jgi:hypothetical protein
MSTKVGSLAGSLADALSNQTDSQRVRGEIAGLMGIAPDRASFAQRLRLDRATLLAIEIERQQAAQCQGQAVDVARLTAASEELERLIPATNWTEQDLSRLNDGELDLLGRLLGKMAGEHDEDVIEATFVGEPKPIAAPVVASTVETEQLRWKHGRDSVTIAELRARVAELQSQIEAASIPETDAEARLLKLLQATGVAAA